MAPEGQSKGTFLAFSGYVIMNVAMKFLVCASLILVGGSPFAVSADEGTVCMVSAELEAGLVDWHNETLVSWNGSDTYIWASGLGGSWTAVQYAGSGPDEIACVIDQGQNWAPGLSRDVLLASAD